MGQPTGPFSSERTIISYKASINPSNSPTYTYKVGADSLIKDLIISFPLNQQRLLQVIFYIGQTGTTADEPMLNYPTGLTGASFSGDNNQLVFRDLNIPIQAGSFFTVFVWNTDTINTHTLDLQVVIARVEATA